MRPIATAILLLSFAGFVAARQDGPVFRGTSDTVPVYVTAVDKSERLVTTLTRDDFQLFDNGKPQPITIFDNSPRPVRLIVMLDVSGSMLGNLPILREAAEQLFSRLSPDDAARVGTFGGTIDISPTFTRDIAALRSALPEFIDPGAPTPLWRAIDQAMTELAGVTERKVVLVLSDGKDSGAIGWRQKFVGQTDVAERALREEVMVYGIGMQSRGMRGGFTSGVNMASRLIADMPDPGLGTVALESGGGYFEIRPRDNLAAAFARVIDELHSQYLLGFAPAARDGKTHKLEVKVSVRDVKPRARKEYVAPKD